MYLRLRKHVETPRTHPAVCRNADQVVGILGAHHVHAVHGVLRSIRHRQKKQQDETHEDLLHDAKM